jgi:hypothetical protein
MSISTNINQVQIPQEESEDFNIQEELDKLWRQAEAKYSKNKKFKQLQEELFSIPDRDSLKRLLGKATKDEAQNLKDRRKSMVRRTGAALTELCTALSKFLENYSSIADIIKGAEPRFGSIAYGGLSVLLTASHLFSGPRRQPANHQLRLRVISMTVKRPSGRRW